MERRRTFDELLAELAAEHMRQLLEFQSSTSDFQRAQSSRYQLNRCFTGADAENDLHEVAEAVLLWPTHKEHISFSTVCPGRRDAEIQFRSNGFIASRQDTCQESLLLISANTELQRFSACPLMPDSQPPMWPEDGAIVVAEEEEEKELAEETELESFSEYAAATTADACSKGGNADAGSCSEQQTFALRRSFVDGLSCHLTRLEEEDMSDRVGTVGYEVGKLYAFFNTLEEPMRTGMLATIVTSHLFGCICMSVIMLNAVLNSFTSQQEMRTLTSDVDSDLQLIEFLFIFFYSFELLLKLVVHREYFFCNPWNVFDFVLVLQAVVFDVVLYLFAQGGKGNSMAFARMVRLLKLGKVLRIFRALRFLSELRVMVLTIIGSALTLFWSFVLLGLILYIFSLILIQTLSGHIIASMESPSPISDEKVVRIKFYFGTIWQSMLTLYMCTNGGIDWQEVHGLVVEAGAIAECTLLFFIAFYNFAFLNIMSGILLKKAMSNMEPDREQAASHTRKKEAEDAVSLRSFVQRLDFQGDGFLSMEALKSNLVDDEVLTYLAGMDIDLRDAEMFYSNLQEVSGHSEGIAIDDFIEHCFRMKGSASGVDMAALMHELKIFRQEMNECYRLELPRRLDE